MTAGEIRANDAGDDEGDGRATANIWKVDEAIKDPMFWAYLGMLDVLGEVLETSSRTFEGCPCHRI